MGLDDEVKSEVGESHGTVECRVHRQFAFSCIINETHLSEGTLHFVLLLLIHLLNNVTFREHTFEFNTIPKSDKKQQKKKKKKEILDQVVLFFKRTCGPLKCSLGSTSLGKLSMFFQHCPALFLITRPPS